MKRILFTALLLVIGWPALAQESKPLPGIPLENGQVVYRQSYQVPDMARVEIFRRARRWWVDNFVSAKDALQIQDETTGELVGKSLAVVTAPAPKKIDEIRSLLNYTLAIDIFEGGYKVKVSDFSLQRSLTGLTSERETLQEYKRFPEKNRLRVIESVDAHVKSVLASIHEYVLTQKQ